MAEESLPNEFDVIVVGTGLSESILSGALSRIGKKVLHLDHNKHYGSAWSSFNLRGFESWVQVQEGGRIDEKLLEEAGQKVNLNTELFVPINSVRKTTEQGESFCYVPEQKQVNPPQKVDNTEEDEKSATEDTPADTTDERAENVEPSKKEHNEEEASTIGTDKTQDCCPSDDKNASQSVAPDHSTPDEAVEVEKVGETGGIIKASFDKKESKPVVQVLSQDAFYASWRHYNLDLAPKLMFSRGKLVELLITSNVCRYLEFRNVTRTLTLLDSGSDAMPQLAPVPCSRTDVFTSKFVTMIEKRMLMRILTMCANYENHPDEYSAYRDGRFLDFLAAKKLSKKLQHFILHSIAMVDENVGTIDGLKATQKFLKSLGRYGNSAFLWALYGVGELPQAFCRLSAVFGGTFCLNRSLCGIIVNKESGKCVGIIDTTGQRLDCEHLIIDECYVPESHRVPFSNIVSRAIYVTDGSLLPSDTENVSLITIPPMNDLPSSRLIEVGAACCVCPPKHYIVHAMSSISQTESDSLPSPRYIFAPIEKLLFGDSMPDSAAEGSPAEASPVAPDKISDPEACNVPKVLWASYFNMMSGGVDTDSIPANVHVTRGPSMDLGFDETVLEAQRLFETICPDEEFLPRAPNPDEIVYFDQDDEGYNTESNEAAQNPAQQEEGGDYQEDESEGDCGSGEVAYQEPEPDTAQEQAPAVSVDETNEQHPEEAS